MHGADAPSDGAARGRRPRRCTSRSSAACSSTRRSATSYAVDGVSSRSPAGRRTGWSASPAAASRLSAGRSCGWSSRPPGRCCFDGVDIAHAAAARSCAACAGGCRWSSRTRCRSLDPRQTVESMLSRGHEGARARSATRRAHRTRLRELLDAVGLPRHGAAPVPARVLRRPAAAHRHRPRAVRRARPDRRRRAGLRAGRLGAGPGDQPARGAAGRPRPDLPGHRARPGRRPAHLRPGRRDVPGRAGRGGAGATLYDAAAAPVHAGADVGGAGAGPGGGGPARADPAHR